MAALNLSTNGSSISKSYQSVVDAPPPKGGAAQSPTYGQWAVFSVSAPLANAFQQDTGGKESILKVQSTGEGELIDLIDEFSDGRIQFAFAKVKDPNTTLPKSVLIGWCGEGVPERTKGYFTSHLAAVAKTLHGYHVQVTARSDRDLTPESIVQKVSDASGSKYFGGASASGNSAPPPPVSSKPAFTPTRSSAGAGGFNPLASSRSRPNIAKSTNVDEDGWGEDAPPITRTQLEKVQSSYQPTKVNIRELNAQQPESPRISGGSGNRTSDDGEVIKGNYQPIGKVDIAALRRQSQQASATDDRPTIVKGAYEPVGKVDIAAIRAKAQRPGESPASPPSNLSPAATGSSARSGDQGEEGRSLPDRSAPFSTSERLTSLPKPKVANRFGSSTSSFAGTKAPTPSEFGLESKATPAAPPVGVGRSFADKGGKTPAQLWAEKKARERGLSGTSDVPPPVNSPGAAAPIVTQQSGGGQWKSGYEGKSWAPVSTTRTGQSAGEVGEQHTGDGEVLDDAPASSAGSVGAIRDRFKGAPPMGASNVGADRAAPTPPPLDTSSKPNAGRGMALPELPSQPAQAQEQQQEEDQEVPSMPSPPPQPPRSPTPPTPPAMETGSPIRIAMPVGRGHNDQDVEDAREEQLSPPPAMPARSLAQAVPHEDDLTEEPIGRDPARGAAEATASASFGAEVVESAHPGAHESGKRAVVQYDYEKGEDNEVELKEGEHVTNIEMVDDNWWMGQNAHGESGLFPSNYVELVEGDEEQDAPAAPESGQGATATAMYDYEAVEENELSFPEDAKITGIEFPDEDWWSGEYEGQQGLFPANYVTLDE